MNEKILDKRTQELISSAIGVATEKVNRLISAGVIKIEDYGDDYLLPKIVATLVLSEASKQTMPFDESARQVVRKLK